jgi:hypothetical protein
LPNYRGILAVSKGIYHPLSPSRVFGKNWRRERPLKN